MGLTSAYLVAASNLGRFLEAVRSARAPDKFTLKFIEDLGFKSTNDRLFIPLFKALRLVDENGVPTQRYFDFLDESRSKAILADGVQDAYEDLFRLNKRAYKLSRADLTGKFKSLTEGKKSDSVLSNMVKTFMELVKFADFESSAQATPPSTEPVTIQETPPSKEAQEQAEVQQESKVPDKILQQPPPVKRLIDTVSYRIEIVLPAVRDKAVYDAIFRSLREHLL